MIATYAAVLAVCLASLAIGGAAIALCGQRSWSWLSPAVGLALLCAICWGTVRLPGHGTCSAIAVLAITLASLLYLRGRTGGLRTAFNVGAPVALIALAAASIPFIVEGHFGILGTGFNPDMSQHLLAADRLAGGRGSQLLRQGYPLGPHAIVVALKQGLGIGLVEGFSGLTVSVVVLSALTALAAFAALEPLRRLGGALLVGISYPVASYFAQGDFKETMQALFVLAFALSLRQISRPQRNEEWLGRPLRMLPPALLAVGSVYTYSFPGLTWLLGAAAIWGLAEFALTHKQAAGRADRADTGGGARSQATGSTSSLGRNPAILALLVFAVLTAPEIGRMIDFRHFETFNPSGPGLGNLFGQISPFEALGIWPSGDFRLAPGNGAVPALGYYLAILYALALFGYGLIWCWRRRETAILSTLAAATLAYLAARIAGTPYTAAKAIEIAAPVAMLTILLPLLGKAKVGQLSAPRKRRRAGFAAALFVCAAGACSLLALANAPIGPTSYSPALAELRPLVTSGSTLVLAPSGLLADQHGVPFLDWELRGGRVCIKSESEVGHPLPAGVRYVIAEADQTGPPFAHLRLRRVDAPYELWQRTGALHGRSPCPLIAVRQARQGPPR